MNEMNRELKFRVWDEKKDCWIKDYIQYYPEEPIVKQGHTIQQFTGMLDKNGNEIYEGDIIRGKFDMGPGGMTIHTAIVRWANEEGYQWNYWDLDTIEVVGNIFEKHIPESFYKAMKDIEEGKTVPLNKALNEIPIDHITNVIGKEWKPAEEYYKKMNYKNQEPEQEALKSVLDKIEDMDKEREAWKKMFMLQSKLVVGAELKNIELEKEIEGYKKFEKLYKECARVAEKGERECKIDLRICRENLEAIKKLFYIKVDEVRELEKLLEDFKKVIENTWKAFEGGMSNVWDFEGGYKLIPNKVKVLREEIKRLDKLIQLNMKDLHQVVDERDHLYDVNKTLKGERDFLQACLNNVNQNLKKMTGEK